MKKIIAFSIALALIVSMPGCFTPFRTQYQLAISSTEGGSVTTPGEGIFTYWEGTVVTLAAEANECYHFNNWTGNVSTMGDINTASTNITMNCDYFITANFAEIPTDQYQLVINSTEGGSVTIPGEGIFAYDEGTVVNLVADAHAEYQFAEWAGNVHTIADIYAATTNITMSDDYQITACFYRVYRNYCDITRHVITSQDRIDLPPH